MEGLTSPAAGGRQAVDIALFGVSQGRGAIPRCPYAHEVPVSSSKPPDSGLLGLVGTSKAHALRLRAACMSKAAPGAGIIITSAFRGSPIFG